MSPVPKSVKPTPYTAHLRLSEVELRALDTLYPLLRERWGTSSKGDFLRVLIRIGILQVEARLQETGEL